jgi:hypothetical protein
MFLLNGIQEVRGSNPLGSAILRNAFRWLLSWGLQESARVESTKLRLPW